MNCQRSDNLNTKDCECPAKGGLLCQISKGAKIHAGDGGYSLGSREAYETFVAKRNYQIPPPKDNTMSCEHMYSRAMFQEYPRPCIKCGEPETLFKEQKMKTPEYTKINVDMLKLVQFEHPYRSESEQKLTWERGFAEGWNAALNALTKTGDVYVETK